MKTKHMRECFAVTVAVMTAAWSARADNVEVTTNFAGNYSGLEVSIASNYYDDVTGSNANPGAHGTVAGIYEFYNATVLPGGDPTLRSDVLATIGADNKFNAICIDLAHNVSWDQRSTWKVVDLTSVLNSDNGVGINSLQANALRNLWNSHYAESVGDNVKAARFQMAAWDILYKSNLPGYSSSASPVPMVSYSNGAPGVDPTGAAAWATAAYASGSSTSTVYALVNLDANNRLQSFAMAVTPVPLPAAAGLGFSMLVGFGSFFGFRKKLSRPSSVVEGTPEA